MAANDRDKRPSEYGGSPGLFPPVERTEAPLEPYEVHLLMRRSGGDDGMGEPDSRVVGKSQQVAR